MKSLCRVFDSGLYIQRYLWETIVESIQNIRRAGNCFIILLDMEEGEVFDPG